MLEFLILAGLALWLGVALRSCRKHKGACGGCDGCCEHCGGRKH